MKRWRVNFCAGACHVYVPATDVEFLSRAYTQPTDGSEDFDADANDDDDRDADAMLEYIEQFNELMEDKRYDEAALHAANGPRGILRTYETMQRFAGEYLNGTVARICAAHGAFLRSARIRSRSLAATAAFLKVSLPCY